MSSFKMKGQNNSVFFKKVNYLFSASMAVILVLLLTLPSHAHEMWIEPLKFSIQLPEKVQAHEKVGQNFKGNTYSYLASSFENFSITEGGKTRPIKSRLGDKPAVKESVSEEGLVILSAISTGSNLTYETREKFEAFINAEKLDWVYAAHKKRGLPDKGFNEVFRRYPKALVKVGHGKGDDQVLGLPFEWVLETNPYTSKGDIKARLLWQGKPFANSYVSVFNRISDDSNTPIVTKLVLKTDSEGRVEIPRAKGGVFLINAVHMIEPSAEVSAETGAVWESLWASIVYEIEASN